MQKNKFGQHKSRVRLLNKMTLGILLVVTLLALWLVAPSRLILVELISRSTSSQVSLSFLQQLYKSQPDDPQILKLIVINHFNLGDYDDVELLLGNGIRNNLANQDPELVVIYLQSLLLKGKRDDDAVLAQQQNVRQILFQLTSPSNANTAQELASIALQVGMPQRAFQFQYPHLKDSQTGRKMLIDLALQSGDLTSAVELQRQVFNTEQTLENAEKLMSEFTSSFNPQMSASFFRQYEGELIHNTEFLKLVIAHSQMIGNYQVALDFALKVAEEEPSADHYAKEVELAIQLDQLPLAIASLNTAISYDDRREFYSQLHQLYVWQDEIDNAQRISLILLTRHPSLSEVRVGIKESQALGDIESEATFFRYLVNQNQIEPVEYARWFNAVEKGFGTPEAIVQVEGLLKHRPKDNQLWSHLIRLYHYQSDYSYVVSASEQLRQLRSFTVKEASTIADVYIMLGQGKLALKTLISPINWSASDDQYIATVSSLAWQQSDKATLLQAQRVLIARRSENIDGYKLLRVMHPLSADNLRELLAIYQIHQDSDLLLESLRYLAQLGDINLFKQALALADADPNLKDELELLFFHAQLAGLEGKPLEARDYYVRILERSPQNKDALIGLFWLTLDSQDTTSLTQLYQQYRLPMQDNPDFWLVFGSTSQALGKWSEAEFWYRKILRKEGESNTSVLLNYASLLDSQGKTEKASQLRGYLLTKKSQQLMSLDDNQVTYRNLIAMYLGQPVSAKMVEALAVSKPSEAVTQELYGYLLADQNIQRIQFWQYRAAFSQYVLPDWQQLSIAIQTGDKAKVDQLLETSMTLSAVDRHSALSLVGKNQQAWALGQKNIGRLNDDTQNSALRQSQVQLHPSKNHSVQAQMDNITHWGVSRYSLNYYQPNQHGYWRLGNTFQQADTPDIIASTPIDDEFRLIGRYTYQFDVGQWSIGADLADGVGDQRLGFLFEYQQQLDRRLSGRFTLGLNNHSEASQLMNIAGQDSLIGFGLNYQMSEYESLDFLANYHFLSTRFGDDIGQGWELNIRASEQLFRSDPAWQVYADLAWQKADLNKNELTGFNRWQKGPEPLTGNSFLSDEYQRFSIGQRLWHGEPGIPGATVPSPRYWLETSVGYNFTENNIDFGAGAGLGWRIFGNDELYLSSNWQSQDRNGDASLTTTLGYYYSF